MNTTKTPWFVLNSPELGRPFADFCESCESKGVLDDRTKELLLVVLASVFQRHADTEEHLKAALEAGATREEITEALLMAALECARTQMALSEDIFERYLR